MAQNPATSGAMAPIAPPPIQSPAPVDTAPIAKPAPKPVTTAQPVTPPRIPTVTEPAAETRTVASRESAPSEPATRTRSTRDASASTPVSSPAVETSAAPVVAGESLASADLDTVPIAPVAEAEPLGTSEASGNASAEPALGEEELALAALAGLLGLGAVGGVMVARRRRKPVEDAPAAEIEAEPSFAPEPVAAAPAVAPAIARTEPERPARKAVPLGANRVQPAATGSLASQIDYTKPAGYYESMVDQGPSAINPFLTRRKRIARAKFLDRLLERSEDSRLAERGGEDFSTQLRKPAFV